jgi:uncharacterized protein (DUF952 family)
LSFIYHIATSSDWTQALQDGEYTMSTKGRTLAQLQYDDVPGEADPYPHIYGPLNTDAVVEIHPHDVG